MRGYLNCFERISALKSFVYAQILLRVQGGSDIEVDDDNKHEYIELMFKYYMFERIKTQLQKLMLGFYEVVHLAEIPCFLPYITHEKRVNSYRGLKLFKAWRMSSIRYTLQSIKTTQPP